jgi:demethylmenaquinone methyltransferase/2-methoxy-6-polyprenyl-1,4-benzoquinol methylase
MTDFESYKLNNENPGERKKEIRRMFDSIVPTYDFLNHFLSAGIDRGWRKFLLKKAEPLNDKKILDLCCGTGDLSRVLVEADIHSLDFSIPMLQKGKEKGWLGSKTIAGDAGNLPFKRDSIDIMTIAFGIRNIPDLDNFMQECLRVLNKNGELLVLELTRPKLKLVGLFYRFYLGVFLPLVGGLISRKKNAYKYLSGTINTFPDPPLLKERFLKNGFSEVEIFPLTFGIASLIVCKADKK